MLNADPSRQWEGLSCRRPRDMKSLSISSFQLKQQQTGLLVADSQAALSRGFWEQPHIVFQQPWCRGKAGPSKELAQFPPPCLPSPCATALTCCLGVGDSSHNADWQVTRGNAARVTSLQARLSLSLPRCVTKTLRAKSLPA